MRREPRMLMPAMGDSLPSQVLVFDTIYSHEKSSNSQGVERLTPLAIYYARWRWRNGKKLLRSEGWADLGESWWANLYKLSSPGTVTWCISASAYTDWTALRLWDKIVCGQMIIDTPDVLRPEADKGGGNRSWRGYTVLEDPPTIVVCRFGDKPAGLTIVDIRNYGVPMRPSWDESNIPWSDEGGCEFRRPDQERDNCISRCKRIETFVTDLGEWLLANGLGAMKTTFSSQGYYSWRRKQVEPKVLLHTNVDALEMERAAYYGGRCECKIIRESVKDVWQLDFNSLYPHCAANTMMPCKLAGVLENVDTEALRDICKNHCVVAEIDVDTPEPCLPCRVEDIVIYPTGKFTTTIAGPELFLAVKYGHVKKIRRLAYYAMDDLFSEFYGFWLAERQQAKDNLRHDFASFLKAGANGLIGKLAQRNKRWQRMPDEYFDAPFACWYQANPVSGQTTVWRSFAGDVSYLMDDGEGGQSAPAIAAYITSEARLLLWAAMSIVGHENVYYYDTDSVWCNTEGKERLELAGVLHETEPGKLKIVDHYDVVTWNGIKHYVADGNLTCAGIPVRAKNKHGYGFEFIEARKAASDMWAKRTPFAELVHRRIRAPHSYRHGKVGEDGKIQPWNMEEFSNGNEKGTD